MADSVSTVAAPITELDARVVATARCLVAEMVENAGHGHPGTALSLVPILHLLYDRHLRIDPDRPTDPGRDRVVLSSGHAAAGLYAALFLHGYGIEREWLRAFRRTDSSLPGHPEVGRTPGVDATTGALGQGLGLAVGMALAAQTLHPDRRSAPRTVVITGEGDFQEGISHEAGALAGKWRLEGLRCIYNVNDTTLDGPAGLSESDDVSARFRGYGWRVHELDLRNDELPALDAALCTLFADSGEPTMLIVRTTIAAGSPGLRGRVESHGSPLGPAEVAAMRHEAGLSPEPFSIDEAICPALRSRRASSAQRRGTDRVELPIKTAGAGSDDALAAALAAIWRDRSDPRSPRDTSQHCVTAIGEHGGPLLVGSADITAGTGTAVASDATRAVRQVRFGIREHAMMAALAGAGLFGEVLPVGGTYLAFSDYLRPALRLAGLANARCVVCLSHDGFDTAFDGPTHHAPEHITALRLLPGVRVLRPADARETCELWELIAARDLGAVALVLSREPVDAVPRAEDGTAAAGAYIALERPDAEITLVGTGIDVHLALAGAELLEHRGVVARVVSAPSWELFASQPASYRSHVLPADQQSLIVEATVAPPPGRGARHLLEMPVQSTSAAAAELRQRNGLTPEAVARMAMTMVVR